MIPSDFNSGKVLDANEYETPERAIISFIVNSSVLIDATILDSLFVRLR